MFLCCVSLTDEDQYPKCLFNHISYMCCHFQGSLDVHQISLFCSSLFPHIMVLVLTLLVFPKRFTSHVWIKFHLSFLSLSHHCLKLPFTQSTSPSGLELSANLQIIPSTSILYSFSYITQSKCASTYPCTMPVVTCIQSQIHSFTITLMLLVAKTILDPKLSWQLAT